MIWRILNKIEDWKNEIKFGFQRMFRGFDDTAYWSLDWYLAYIILPVLKKYKQDSLCGCPFNKETQNYFTEEEWDKKLGKMIKAFELIINQENTYIMESWEENEKIITEGLTEFAKYYQDLWS